MENFVLDNLDSRIEDNRGFWGFVLSLPSLAGNALSLIGGILTNSYRKSNSLLNPNEVYEEDYNNTESQYYSENSFESSSDEYTRTKYQVSRNGRNRESPIRSRYPAQISSRNIRYYRQSESPRGRNPEVIMERSKRNSSRFERSEERGNTQNSIPIDRTFRDNSYREKRERTSMSRASTRDKTDRDRSTNNKRSKELIIERSATDTYRDRRGRSRERISQDTRISKENIRRARDKNFRKLSRDLTSRESRESRSRERYPLRDSSSSRETRASSSSRVNDSLRRVDGKPTMDSLLRRTESSESISDSPPPYEDDSVRIMRLLDRYEERIKEQFHSSRDNRRRLNQLMNAVNKIRTEVRKGTLQLTYDQLVAMLPYVYVPAKNKDDMPVFRWQGQDDSEIDETETKCTICLLEFDIGELLKTLPCFHKFHVDCVDPWLDTHNTCPVCKYETDKDIRLNNYNGYI